MLHHLNSATGVNPEDDFTDAKKLNQLRPVSSMTDDEAAELGTIHRYDKPESKSVKEELIYIYENKNGEILMLVGYISIKHYFQGLIWLYQNGFDVSEWIPDNLKSLLDNDTRTARQIQSHI